MKKNTVKNIVIFFLVFLPLQYAAVGVIGVMDSEPWPAFVLPAFKSVYATANQVTVEQLQMHLVNTRTGHTKQIEPQRLFQEVNGSQRQGFFRTHFADSTTVARIGEEANHWFKRRIIRYRPSFKANQLNIRWVRKSFDTSVADTSSYTTKTLKSFSISLGSE